MVGSDRERAVDAGASAGPFLEPAKLAELLSGASFPAALWSGSELRFLWANRAFTELLKGAPPQFDALGMPMRGFLSDAPSAMRFQDVAYTGLPQTDAEYEYVAADASVSVWQLTFLPVPGRFGRPHDVLFTGVDVTATVSAKRAEERVADDVRSAMELIDSTILSSLDADEILQRVVVEATEAFGADWGWIAVREQGAWRFRNVHGWPDDSLGQVFREEELSLPRLAAASAATVVEDGVGAVPYEHQELLDRHDIGAFLLVPLRARGETSAVIGFCWNSATRFVEAHLRLADKLASSLSLALENARLYGAEREAARALQSAFFQVPDRVDGVEFGHLYHSASSGARVGGDFYDVLRTSSGNVGVMIGDVAGHGTGVSALTALVKSSMRVEALREPSPCTVVERTNQLVLTEGRTEIFASAFLGMLDCDTGDLAYCLAGHPPPILARKGSAPMLLPGPEMLVGVEHGARYTNHQANLGLGDVLVLYTDGLVEARDRSGKAYGTERLRWAVSGVASEDITAVPQALFLDAFSYAEGRLSDDIAILALRRVDQAASSGPRQGRLELPVAV